MNENMEELYAELRKREHAANEVRKRIYEIEDARSGEHQLRERERARVEMSAHVRKEWEEKGELSGEDLRTACYAQADLSFLPAELAYRFDTGQLMPVLQSPALANAQEQAKALWHAADEKRCENDRRVRELRAANEAIADETRGKVEAIVGALTPQEQQQFGANRVRKEELLRRHSPGTHL